MPKPNRKSVLDALDLSDAAKSKQRTMERRLHAQLMEVYGEGGTLVGRRCIRPGPNCTVISELLDKLRNPPAEPALTIEED